MDRLKHCLAVANKMKQIANKNHEVYESTADEMFVLGMLHDIGYEFSDKQEEHAQKGGELLKEQGYKYWKEIYYHGYPQSYYKSKELTLLNFADLTTGPCGEYMSIDERIEELESRYGEGSWQVNEAKEQANLLSL